MADAVPATSLNFRPLHGTGRTCAAFVASESGGVQLLTCGADGKLVLREPGSLEQVAMHDEGQPIETLAVDVKGRAVAIAVDNKAKILDLPGLSNARVASSATLPIRALAFSPSGVSLASGGDCEQLRVVAGLDSSVTPAALKSDPYVRSLAWDPEGVFLASAEAGGYLAFFEAGAGGKKVRRTKCLPKVNPMVPCDGPGLAWHPDGSLLAAPGTDNDVVLYERLSWEPTLYLSGGHTSPVTTMAFSPNGLYMATACSAGELCVWAVSVSPPHVVSRSSVPPRTAAPEEGDAAAPGARAPATGLAWHPRDNALVVADHAGRVVVWAAPVPEKLSHPAADPDTAVPDLLDEAAAGGADEDEGMDEFIEDDAEHEDNHEARAGRGGGGGSKPRSATGSGAAPSRVVREIVRVVERAPAGPPPQPAFQPGSTQEDILATGPNRGTRFLAYNTLGFISAGPGTEEDCNSVTISFHDTMNAPARVPTLTDSWGLSMGALSSSGALYASTNTLVYRPFDASSHDLWTTTLPEGEDVVAVGAGSGFCAAATSRRSLRLFSPAGAQLAVISLLGNFVALSGQEEGGLLAVASHAAAPDILTKSQNLALEVYDVAAGSLVERCPLPLSPGAELTWLGFTAEGLPITGDSAGVLRVRSPQFGGSWVPVFDGVNESKSGEVFWPVGASVQKLTCVVCPRSAPQPAQYPRPIFTYQAFSAPLLAIDGRDAQLESTLLLQGISEAAARVRVAAVSATGDADAAAAAASDLAASVQDSDLTLMKLLNAACLADAHARGLEFANRLAQEQFVEAAVKLANARRMPRLAEAVGLLLLARREARANAEAAEAAHQAAQQQQQQEYQNHADDDVTELDGDGDDAGGDAHRPLSALNTNTAPPPTAAAAPSAIPSAFPSRAAAPSMAQPAPQPVKRKLPAATNPFARTKKHAA